MMATSGLDKANITARRWLTSSVGFTKESAKDAWLGWREYTGRLNLHKRNHSTHIIMVGYVLNAW